MWFARPHQPDLLGYLDRVAAGRVSGWVRDRLRPGARLDIEVFAAGALPGRTRADGFRQDLRDSGLGDGITPSPSPCTTPCYRKPWRPRWPAPATGCSTVWTAA